MLNPNQREVIVGLLLAAHFALMFAILNAVRPRNLLAREMPECLTRDREVKEPVTKLCMVCNCHLAGPTLGKRVSHGLCPSCLLDVEKERASQPLKTSTGGAA